MRNVRFSFGAFVMIFTLLLSDRAEILLLYVLSVTLHECGHLLAARHLRIGIKEIRFELSGVRICTEDELTSYKNELILALSGPLANLVVVSACAVFLFVVGESLNEVSDAVGAFLISDTNSWIGAVGFLALISAMQGAVNLLPVKTFDGGRILCCLLALIWGERVAQSATVLTTAIFALSLWTVALYLMLKVSAGLGIFVFAACVFFSTVGETEKRHPV